MRFFTIISGIVLTIAAATAQVTAPTQNYNVSSPVPNGPYVAGQILPCTIRVLDNIVSGRVCNN
ncbi:uncharacterized protein BX663DRAFT_523201 [Cokeromyces recurvatus]|uniref:uncharacterized protein n=1 Tax=Cokeromyces recurvatus TaxID=90255 RepID=UPI002220A264|nr:uncharacterized protein BX663DRAFT_523201 [Cokeromyces recurvatus]KAI7898904.1 hypothetical protein BX663DRAFT_523201 [Cokeromyces recurvatus]